MKIHPLCEAFTPIKPDAFDEIVADIKENGQILPITVLDGQVLDGRHRMLACQRLGIELKTEEYQGDNPLKFVISMNKMRRQMTPSDWAMTVARLATATVGGDRKSAEYHCQMPDNDIEITQGELAKEVGITRQLVSAANQVITKGSPKLVEAVDDGIVTVSDAVNIVHAPPEDQDEAATRARENRDRTATSALNIINNERLSEETMPPLPEGEFRVVVVDPPWPISPTYDRPNRLLQSAGPPYPTMTIDEIKEMKLPLADDAWVLLWTIKQFVRESFSVLDAWGVEYDDLMVWHKPHGPQSAGRMQSNREFVLVGKKGSPKWRDTKQFQACFNAPNPKAHSTKPDEFYETIKRVTVGPRLDMFSRRLIEGFYPWGKEAKR